MRARLPALCLFILACACSQGTDGARDGTASPPLVAKPAGIAPGAPTGTGTVGLALTIPGGARIDRVAWAIAGPSGSSAVVQSGSMLVTGDALQFLVGGVPSGAGYHVSIAGTSDDDSVTCSGAATFDVAPRATTLVAAQLVCSSVAVGSAATDLDGGTFDCAAWSSVSATPSETTVGSAVTLHATASGPVAASLSYVWSASSGFFDDASASTATFTCTEAGAVSVSLRVADGPVPIGSTCNSSLDSASVRVTCDPRTVAPVPALPTGGLFAFAAAILALGLGATRRGAHTTT